VGLTAEATDKKNVEIVSDAYGLRSNIENERQAFKINRVVARNRSQVTLKEVVELTVTVRYIRSVQCFVQTWPA